MGFGPCVWCGGGFYRRRYHQAADLPMSGRITVTRGQGSVTLSLAHWDIMPNATLTLREARELIDKVEDAIRRSGPVVAQPSTSGLEDLL